MKTKAWLSKKKVSAQYNGEVYQMSIKVTEVANGANTDGENGCSAAKCEQCIDCRTTGLCCKAWPEVHACNSEGQKLFVVMANLSRPRAWNSPSNTEHLCCSWLSSVTFRENKGGFV